MRYAPRRKIKKVREIEGAGNDYHLLIWFMIGDGDDGVLDVDDLSKPNETVYERCAMMARAGILYNHYEDKKCKRKREWDLKCDNKGVIKTVPRRGRWVKGVVIKGEVILRG